MFNNEDKSCSTSSYWNRGYCFEQFCSRNKWWNWNVFYNDEQIIDNLNVSNTKEHIKWKTFLKPCKSTDDVRFARLIKFWIISSYVKIQLKKEIIEIKVKMQSEKCFFSWYICKLFQSTLFSFKEIFKFLLQ